MNNINRFLASAIVTLAFANLSSPASAALVEYSYIGNPMEDFYQGGLNDFLSIDFIIDDSLIPKNSRFVLPESDPLQVNFALNYFYMKFTFPGTPVLTTLPPSYITDYKSAISMSFDTDAEGNIGRSWQVSARQSGTFGGRPEYVWSSLVQSVNDSSIGIFDAYDWGYDAAQGAEYIGGNPGKWTRTVVPIPGAMVLFGSAIVGIYVNMRLSRQKRSPSSD
jgi:hypothetical protein